MWSDRQVGGWTDMQICGQMEIQVDRQTYKHAVRWADVLGQTGRQMDKQIHVVNQTDRWMDRRADISLDRQLGGWIDRRINRALWLLVEKNKFIFFRNELSEQQTDRETNRQTGMKTYKTNGQTDR